MITCPRCGMDALVRVGEAIPPPPQRFRQDTYGPTRITPINMEPRYPVVCKGYYTLLAPEGRGIKRRQACDWQGSLVGRETETLLEQIVRRTGDVNV